MTSITFSANLFGIVLVSMKPRLFIGSSREGVDIANAVHQNLYRDAEITVWDQGVFDLSVSTLDSLVAALEASRLGVFVFSPDDVVRIRGTESPAVRDNVVFELGLFIGRLSKRHCFILMPEGYSDLHLPTDLVGMTAATYEWDRTDDNLEAATGPACSRIRNAIKKLGLIPLDKNAPEGPPPKSPQSSDNREKLEAVTQDIQKPPSDGDPEEGPKTWLDAFFADQIDVAVGLREIELSNAATEGERFQIRTSIAILKTQGNLSQGIHAIEELIVENPEDYGLYEDLALVNKWKGRYAEAFNALERGLIKAANKSPLVDLKAQCLGETGASAEAISLLSEYLKTDPGYEQFYSTLANLYSERGDKLSATNALKYGLLVNPNSEPILSTLGQLLDSTSGSEIALFIYHRLTQLFPENSTYLALLGNVYVSKELYGLALDAYERANGIAGEKEGWIIANIGNILNHKGLNPLAMSYLNKALSVDPESSYAHARLSEAIKNQEDEGERLVTLLKSAKASFYSSLSEAQAKSIAGGAPIEGSKDA